MVSVITLLAVMKWRLRRRWIMVIRIVWFRRLSERLADETKVKRIDFILHRRVLAHDGLRFGGFELTRGCLVRGLALQSGRLQVHVFKVSVNGRLTLVRHCSVKVGHLCFDLSFSAYGLRGFLVILVVNTTQTLVLVRPVIPGLMRVGEIITIGRTMGEMCTLGDARFEGSVRDGNDGGVVTGGDGAQSRRLDLMRIRCDLSVKRGQGRTFAPVGRIAC